MKNEQSLTNFDSLAVTAVDMKIASLLIENPSMTDQMIAEKVGLSRQTVNRRKNSVGVREVMRSILAIPEREVRRLSAKALTRMEQMLDHEDPKIQLAAATVLTKLGVRLVSDNFEESLLKTLGTI